VRSPSDDPESQCSAAWLRRGRRGGWLVAAQIGCDVTVVAEAVRPCNGRWFASRSVGVEISLRGWFRCRQKYEMVPPEGWVELNEDQKRAAVQTQSARGKDVVCGR
jgi:hypothetical protein